MVFAESFFNALFGWSIDISPLFGLGFISLVLTLVVTIVYKLMTDQALLKDMKDEMKQMRKDMKEFANDPVKLGEIQKKMSEASFKQLRHTMKPTLVTMIPMFIAIYWIRNTFEPLQINFLGITSWLWTYIILSFVFSLVLRKILKVH